jgi:hypothetical protein
VELVGDKILEVLVELKASKRVKRIRSELEDLMKVSMENKKI